MNKDVFELPESAGEALNDARRIVMASQRCDLPRRREIGLRVLAAPIKYGKRQMAAHAAAERCSESTLYLCRNVAEKLSEGDVNRLCAARVSIRTINIGLGILDPKKRLSMLLKSASTPNDVWEKEVESIKRAEEAARRADGFAPDRRRAQYRKIAGTPRAKLAPKPVPIPIAKAILREEMAIVRARIDRSWRNAARVTKKLLQRLNRASVAIGGCNAYLRADDRERLAVEIKAAHHALDARAHAGETLIEFLKNAVGILERAQQKGGAV